MPVFIRDARDVTRSILLSRYYVAPAAFSLVSYFIFWSALHLFLFLVGFDRTVQFFGASDYLILMFVEIRRLICAPALAVRPFFEGTLRIMFCRALLSVARHMRLIVRRRPQPHHVRLPGSLLCLNRSSPLIGPIGSSLGLSLPACPFELRSK